MSRVLLLVGTCVVLGASGCGAPVEEDAGGRRQARQSLEDGPDFIVREVHSPASIQPGDSLPVSVTVCNQGTWEGSTSVALVLSDGSQELPLADLYTDWLQAGQCRTQQMQVQTASEGIWSLKAVANAYAWDWEVDETNNTLVGNTLSVGVGPDYVIQSVSGPAAVQPGGTVTVSVRTCNQGTTNGGTDVQLVISDGSQSQPVASFTSGLLPAGQCSTRQVEAVITAPHEGVWFLGAVADPGHSAPEINETNNALAGNTLSVGVGPDYVIQAVSGPAIVKSFFPFPVSVTVCNQGSTGGATDVQLVASPSDGGAGEELELGYLYVDGLEAGQCSTQQVEVWATPYEGSWTLSAVADPYQAWPELLEDNNTLVGNRVSFGSVPDYVIQSISAPSVIWSWAPFTASVTVCNQGTAEGFTNVQLVVSEDDDIRFSSGAPSGGQDRPVASFTTWLEDGQCSTQQVQVLAQGAGQGLWYLGAVANPEHDEPEFDQANNTGATAVVANRGGQDFLIQEVSAPASVEAGGPFTASVTVCNQGDNGTSSGTDVQVVLSEDTDIRFSNSGASYLQDLPLQSFSTGALMEGQCMTQQLQLSVDPPFGGTWHLGAVVDPGDSYDELIETNNSRASGGIAFQL